MVVVHSYKFSGKHSDRQFHRPEQAIDTASRSMKALTVSLFKSTAPPTFHVHSLKLHPNFLYFN